MVTKKQITTTFTDLVTIDSPSGQETKVATYIIKYLKAIGVKASRDKVGNVIARLEGVGEPLILNAHMDTVEPGKGIKPIVKNNIIKSDGTTILGADDKGAITEILEAVKYLKIKSIKHRPLELVFTKGEEVDFAGSLNIAYKNIQAKDAIILDYSLPPGALVLSAPFIYIIDIKIKGKAAHAGAFPEKGINAIQVAAQAIAELKIGRINKTTVNNIGTIHGGLIRNGVPDLVEIKAEVRAHSQEAAQRQVDLFNKAFKKYTRKNKARLFFKAKLDCFGYTHKRTNPLIKLINEVNKEAGIKTNFIKAVGVSDANVFNRKGLNAVVISKGGSNPHSLKESIKISEMQKMVEILVDICT